QRIHGANRQGAPDGVRGRDEPPHRAPDGGLHWLSQNPRLLPAPPRFSGGSMAEVTALELPTFKGRPGWEFTDVSRLDLSAFAAPPDGDLGAVPEGMFDLAGATRLDQV